MMIWVIVFLKFYTAQGTRLQIGLGTGLRHVVLWRLRYMMARCGDTLGLRYQG